MDNNLIKNLGDPISDQDSTNKKYVDNLTNTNETRSKHNSTNILTLFNRTKKINTDGNFIADLDMNNQNIKNMKVEKTLINSVSTIGYTNEKIGKPGTDIDMQELNSIINLKDIDNASKDGYATNKKYVDTKTHPAGLIKSTGGIDNGTIQLDNNNKLKVNLSDDFSVDSTTGSIKIKNTNTNNFIEPLEVENKTVKLNHGYGLGIKEYFEVEGTKKKLEVILYSDGGLKFVPAAQSNFGISLDINSYDFKIENSKLKLNYGYDLGIEDDFINLGKTLNVVVDPSNCISYKKIDYKLDGKDISSYGLIINNGQGLKINNNKLELDIDNPFKLENNKLKLNYGNGLRLSKDLNSKLELYIDSHAGLEYWGSTEGQKYLGLSKNIANSIGLIENSGLTLKLDDGQNKLNIDIDVLKGLLYNILGDNLIYNSTTKKLDVKIMKLLVF